MSREEIIDKLDAYIREHFEIEDDDDNYSTSVDLFEEGYCDSFGSAEIIAFIEDEFGVRILLKDLTMYPMNSVEEIAAVIDRKMNS